MKLLAGFMREVNELSYMRETSYDQVGKYIIQTTLIYILVIILNAVAAYLTGTPNLYFNLASLIFILSTPLAAMIAFNRARKRKIASTINLGITLTIILVGVAILAYATYLLWIALTVRALIRRFEIALSIPILTLIIAYILSERLEKKIPEHYWRLSRAISDRVRGAVSSPATAIIGPTIAFFGLLNFDAYFALLPLAYSIIELSRTIREVIATRKQKKNLDMFNENLAKSLMKIPNVMGIKDAVFDPTNQFLIVGAKFTVSSFLNDEEVEKLIDYVVTFVLENFGIVVFVRVEVEKTPVERVKVALPIKSDNELAETFVSDKYLIAEIDKEGKIISKEVVSIGNSSDKMREVEKAREIVKHKVMVIGYRNIGSLAKRELEGWFTTVMKIDSNDVEEALKEIVSKIIQFFNSLQNIKYSSGLRRY